MARKMNTHDPTAWMYDESDADLPAIAPVTTICLVLGFVIALWLVVSNRSPLHDWFDENYGWAAIFLWLFPLVFGFIFASMLR